MHDDIIVIAAEDDVIMCSWVLHAKGMLLYCRINKGSYENSLKAREEIVKLGVEHRIIPLEWEETPPPGKMHMLTRERRYSSLLQQCQELDIRVLMFGHHQNDQTGEFDHLPGAQELYLLLHQRQLMIGSWYMKLLVVHSQ